MPYDVRPNCICCCNRPIWVWYVKATGALIVLWTCRHNEVTSKASWPAILSIGRKLKYDWISFPVMLAAMAAGWRQNIFYIWGEKKIWKKEKEKKKFFFFFGVTRVICHLAMTHSNSTMLVMIVAVGAKDVWCSLPRKKEGTIHVTAHISIKQFWTASRKAGVIEAPGCLPILDHKLAGFTYCNFSTGGSASARVCITRFWISVGSNVSAFISGLHQSVS